MEKERKECGRLKSHCEILRIRYCYKVNILKHFLPKIQSRLLPACFSLYAVRQE